MLQRRLCSYSICSGVRSLAVRASTSAPAASSGFHYRRVLVAPGRLVQRCMVVVRPRVGIGTCLHQETNDRRILVMPRGIVERRPAASVSRTMSSLVSGAAAPSGDIAANMANRPRPNIAARFFMAASRGPKRHHPPRPGRTQAERRSRLGRGTRDRLSRIATPPDPGLAIHGPCLPATMSAPAETTRPARLSSSSRNTSTSALRSILPGADAISPLRGALPRSAVAVARRSPWSFGASSRARRSAGEEAEKDKVERALRYLLDPAGAKEELSDSIL